MPSLLLVDYLQRSRAQYALFEVPPACRADETARLGRIAPRHFAKAVIARIDGELVMVVMPAHYRLAPAQLRGELGAERVELATERHFRNRFPRCELGAIPPFGHLFGLRALVVPSFDKAGDIFCKAGTHAELLRMPYSEFQRLAHLEPVTRGAVLQLRNPTRSHLQRLLTLAKAGGARVSEPLRAPWPIPS